MQTWQVYNPPFPLSYSGLFSFLKRKVSWPIRGKNPIEAQLKRNNITMLNSGIMFLHCHLLSLPWKKSKVFLGFKYLSPEAPSSIAEQSRMPVKNWRDQKCLQKNNGLCSSFCSKTDSWIWKPGTSRWKAIFGSFVLITNTVLLLADILRPFMGQ